jgi:hypothetical protein
LRPAADRHSAALESEMFFWFLVAVAIVVGLTVLGGYMVRRDPDTDWEVREDKAMGPWVDH